MSMYSTTSISSKPRVTADGYSLTRQGTGSGRLGKYSSRTARLKSRASLDFVRSVGYFDDSKTGGALVTNPSYLYTTTVLPTILTKTSIIQISNKQLKDNQAFTAPKYKLAPDALKLHVYLMALIELGNAKALSMNFTKHLIQRATDSDKGFKNYISDQITKQLEKHLGYKPALFLVIEVDRHDNRVHCHGSINLPDHDEERARHALHAANGLYGIYGDLKDPKVATFKSKAIDFRQLHSGTNWATYCAKDLNRTSGFIPGDLVYCDHQTTARAKEIYQELIEPLRFINKHHPEETKTSSSELVQTSQEQETSNNEEVQQTPEQETTNNSQVQELFELDDLLEEFKDIIELTPGYYTYAEETFEEEERLTYKDLPGINYIPVTDSKPQESLNTPDKQANYIPEDNSSKNASQELTEASSEEKLPELTRTANTPETAIPATFRKPQRKPYFRSFKQTRYLPTASDTNSSKNGFIRPGNGIRRQRFPSLSGNEASGSATGPPKSPSC